MIYFSDILRISIYSSIMLFLYSFELSYGDDVHIPPQNNPVSKKSTAGIVSVPHLSNITQHPGSGIYCVLVNFISRRFLN